MPRTVINTKPARQAKLANAANRAVDDPATLARAARIVRAALNRGALTATDLQGEVVKPADLERVGEVGGADAA